MSTPKQIDRVVEYQTTIAELSDHFKDIMQWAYRKDNRILYNASRGIHAGLEEIIQNLKKHFLD